MTEQDNLDPATIQLLIKARTVIEQFLPNAGHCFGIDFGLINDTLLEIGKVVDAAQQTA